MIERTTPLATGVPPASGTRVYSAVPITSKRVVTFFWVSATPVRVSFSVTSSRYAGAVAVPSRSVSRSRSAKPGPPSTIDTSTRPAIRDGAAPWS